VLLDGVDLIGARAAEIAVITEHALRLRRVLLIEQQLERFGLPDHVRHAQLGGQCGALTLERALLGLPVALQRRARLARSACSCCRRVSDWRASPTDSSAARRLLLS